MQLDPNRDAITKLLQIRKVILSSQKSLTSLLDVVEHGLWKGCYTCGTPPPLHLIYVGSDRYRLCTRCRKNFKKGRLSIINWNLL